jgi:biopolymer transport protein ExbB/TolQ
MAALFAVLVAVLVAIVISVAYALVLRELQRINANLEQFIKLVVDARQREDARQDDVQITNDAPATRQY